MATGTVIIDFGAFPGANEASVDFADAKITADAAIEETREIHREVSEQFIRELGQDREFKPIAQMSMQEIDREIGLLLRKKLRSDEEEIILLLLMAAFA